jgi:hypothetical protein
VNYCGISAGPERHHLCVLREVREAEPPIRLDATFFEPGPARPVAQQAAALEEPVVAVASPLGPPRPGRPERVCDAELRGLGVAPAPFLESGREVFEELADLGIYSPTATAHLSSDSSAVEGPVEDGSYRLMHVIETNADAVFCALEARRVPARRHPVGVRRRIDVLAADRVVDGGGELWHRRIEEIEAAAAALAAHRFAVAHARWLGDPAEGVVVLPGTGPLEPFSTRGVLPPVERVRLEA